MFLYFSYCIQYFKENFITTIVWSNGVLASDSRSTAHSFLVSDTTKKIYLITKDIYYVGDKLLAIAMAGVSSHTDLVLAYLCSQDFPHSGIEHEAHGILVGEKNVYTIEPNEGFLITFPRRQSLAIGSGGDFALSAIKLGLTPEQAIKHAMQFDMATGGKVVSHKL